MQKAKFCRLQNNYQLFWEILAGVGGRAICVVIAIDRVNRQGLFL